MSPVGTHKWFWIGALAAAFAVILVLLVPSGQAQAGAFIVDSTADAIDDNPGDGVCDDGTGSCTLRAAIMEANALAGPDTITLPPGVYQSTIATDRQIFPPPRYEDATASGDFDIRSTMTIRGAGESLTIIDGGAIGRVFHIPDGDLTISHVTIQNGFSDSNTGFMVGVGGAGRLTLHDATVRGNVSERHAGGIGVSAPSVATLTNVTMTENVSLSSVGGGFLSIGTATLTNVELTENTAATRGGGLWNGTSGVLTMHGGAIVGNSARESGGGVWNSGPMTLTDVVLDGNSADTGGGLFVVGGAATLANVTVSDNTATTGNGGGIVVISGETQPSTLSMHGGSVRGNEGAFGGGIDNNGSAVELHDVTISGNHARGNGGGFHNTTVGAFNATLTMYGGALLENTANHDGGGIVNFGGDASLWRVAISNNAAQSGIGGGVINWSNEFGVGTFALVDSMVSDNTADGGGGIFNDSTMSITNSTISGNTAKTDSGGGINQNGGGEIAATLTIRGGSVSGNTAVGNGGGLSNFGGHASLERVAVTNNTATTFGGGGITNFDGELTLTNLSVSGNIAAEHGGGVNGSGTWTLTDVVLDGNSAGTGGGLFFGGGVATLANVTLRDNTATAGNGGGIFVISNETRPSTLLMQSGSVEGNEGAFGGGIDNNGSVVALHDVTISGNHARGNGGGFHNTTIGAFNAILTMYGGALLENSADGHGGGIVNFGGDASLRRVAVSNNAAQSGEGGGVINWSNEFGVATFALVDSTVSGNTAPTAGGIFNDSTMSITNSTISGNTANTYSGGGLSQLDRGGAIRATLTVVHATFSDNAASTFGGGIDNHGGTVTLTATIVADNLAPTDGDCWGFITSLGHNLDSDGTCNLAEGSDISNADPKLQHLKDNGGPTETHMPLPGSPALDAIATGDCAIASDQRGEHRPQADACDIGAVERGAPPIVQTVGGASEVDG